MPASCPKIPKPCDVGAKHRQEVPLSVYNSHHERERDQVAGATAHHLQRDEVVRGNAEGMHQCPASVERPSQGIGAPRSVEPAMDGCKQGQCASVAGNASAPRASTIGAVSIHNSWPINKTMIIASAVRLNGGFWNSSL